MAPMSLRFILDDDNFKGAACSGVDPDLFFPSRSSAYQAHMAKKICNTCPIMEDCRMFALQRPYLVGIWGGTTYRERQSLRKIIRVELYQERVTDEAYESTTTGISVEYYSHW